MNDATQRSMSTLTRRTTLVGLGASGLGLFLAARNPSLAGAQDATPAPMGAVGVTIQLMGGGQPISAPGLGLTLRRTTIAPGGRLPAHSHPGAHVIVVEAGTWGYTPLGGTAQLMRAGATEPPVPGETLPFGTEVILTAGDWLFVEEPQDDIRNAGEDDVVLLVAALATIGEPFTTFLSDMNMDSTPPATPTT